MILYELGVELLEADQLLLDCAPLWLWFLIDCLNVKRETQVIIYIKFHALKSSLRSIEVGCVQSRIFVSDGSTKISQKYFCFFHAFSEAILL